MNRASVNQATTSPELAENRRRLGIVTNNLPALIAGLLLATAVGMGAWWFTSARLAEETPAEAEERILAEQATEEARVAWKREGLANEEFNAIFYRHIHEGRSSRGQSEEASKAVRERHRKEIAEWKARWK